MVANDDAGCLNARVVRAFFASRLAPTVGLRQGDAASQSLGRLAYAAAELLAQGDFNLVRKCESADCSMMFYDRTKSHKRRWCSMALCGNRHKVAEFRKRRQGVVD